MKKYLSGIIILLFFVINAYAQEDVSPSKWQTKKIVVDGNDNEWIQPLNFFDNGSGLIFSVTNDDKNVYLCFSNNDKAKTGKMMTAGWSLELFSSEKKRKFDASIVFPKATDPNINQRSDLKTAIGIYKAEVQTVQAKGFIEKNGDEPLQNKDGLNISIGYDSTEKIIYEIQIPIRELMQQDKVQLNELLTLDITVNALTKPAGQSQGNASAAARSAGFGGGRMGGRMGGGRGGGNRGAASQSNDAATASARSLYEKVSFKQKIRLVNK